MARVGRLISAVLMIVATMGASWCTASDTKLEEAAELQRLYGNMRAKLERSAFGRPLVLTSTEGAKVLAGQIHARLNHSMPMVAEVLGQPANWCEILLLQSNIKACQVEAGSGGRILRVSIGRKIDQAMDKTYKIAFSFSLLARSDQYVMASLTAKEGPFGTHDYQIVVEAVPVGEGHTFLHLSYSYGYGVMARLAVKAYLNTLGRNKVGFSLVSPVNGGSPQPVAGTRAMIERNAMRSYLAIEAFLDASAVPAPARLEARLHAWFSAVAHYPRQLLEFAEADYLSMKRAEFQRYYSQ